MKKTAIIDIGSNSVRLGVFSGGIAEYKTLITSRLGEGARGGYLAEASVNRTVSAVSALKERAFFMGASEIYAFATEAVRHAENGADFTRGVLSETGIKVYVASGEEEARFAVFGALGRDDGAVIDLGGASTEVAVQRGENIIYWHSLPLGAVTLRDACGVGRSALTAYITQKTAEYGSMPHAEKILAVGGTATSVAACVIGLEKYDSAKVHGARVTAEDIANLADRLENLSPQEIASTYPVDVRRAEIIFGGALLLKGVLGAMGAKEYFAGESDNLEGFIKFTASGAAEGFRFVYGGEK